MKYIKKGASRCLQLLALIIFFLVHPWICLASETPVTIRGSFADTAGHEGDLLKYTLLKHPVSPSWPSATESGEVKVSKGRFTIRVKAPSDFFYLSFSLLSAEGAQKHLFYYTAGGPSFFLFSRNDSISMMISKDQQIEFSGRGSERLRCQEQLYGLDYIPLSADKRLNDLQNKGDYASYYRFLLLFLKEHVALKLSVLESYRRQLSPGEYEQVRLDGTGHAFLPLLRGLRFTSIYRDPGARFPYARHLLEEFGKGPWTQQGTGVLQSPYYSRFLFELECATLEFKGTDTARNNFSFAGLSRSIKERYQGPLRDKLMLFAFVEQAKKRGGYERCLRAELDSMPDSQWKDLLVQWEKSAAGGTPAFPFELPDTSGKTYSLSGFRGRVVVADFWFMGCTGCIRMRDPLKAVFDSFRDNPAVVFLSINVDKVKKWWLSGLAQGKYTFPGQIELSTWGLGNDHPMLKYYNFSAYPQLLVWDKEGRSVSRSFLDPRVDGGADLRKLIMETLAAR